MIPGAIWQIAASPPGAEPDAWQDCAAPATAAATLRALGQWNLDRPARRFDAEDWWWRARFSGRGAGTLCLDGLATLADVTLNGSHLLHSESMFIAHRLPVQLAGDNELLIHCHALDAALATRRPRPRWRVPMLEQQQLRWFRTTLLGRTPGWSPPAAAVGPWRDVRFETDAAPARPRAWLSGDTGIVEAAGTIEVVRGGTRIRGAGRVEIARPDRWWPHTHGDPALYEVRIEGRAAGRVGFRSVERNGDFGIAINGVDVFCRGACWMPLDVVSLQASTAQLRAALEQVRAAGMNMLRVSGTAVYESDAFRDLCDELGILVWQDFMCANMDYPPELAPLLLTEAAQELARWDGRPSLAVLCGNSEGEQQAAMWGAGREAWRMPLFEETLAQCAASRRPDVPYWPSSAHGGAFPHTASEGTTSYYGVGAYLRPLEDARRCGLRFATECLAFANLGRAARDPARVPRDLGAGWDFADVRDHYLKLLFQVDPAALRAADPARYAALSRVTSGEVMADTFGEWRRLRSTCRGALIWFLRDLWPCDGWGVVDSDGLPKAAWWALRRALAPLALHISDEGGNGLALHVVNDGPAAVRGPLRLDLWRGGEVAVGGGVRDIEVPAHGALEIAACELLEGFTDLSYAYRFGPPPCELVHASFRGAEAFHHPVGRSAEPDAALALEARAQWRDGVAELVLGTRRFAQSVAIEIAGYTPEDNYFSLAPGASRTLGLRRDAASQPFPPLVGHVQALNAMAATPIVIVRP
ncbi:MAG TPA: hypothetical protein VMI92_13595 [Steroidobacteraceae bacterium]|nr:hypothetical protein [Steroidobacteraceae bacterium]